MSDGLWLLTALLSAVLVVGGGAVGLVLGEVRWAGPGRSELSRWVELLESSRSRRLARRASLTRRHRR